MISVFLFSMLQVLKIKIVVKLEKLADTKVVFMSYIFNSLVKFVLYFCIEVSYNPIKLAPKTT